VSFSLGNQGTVNHPIITDDTRVNTKLNIFKKEYYLIHKDKSKFKNKQSYGKNRKLFRLKSFMMEKIILALILSAAIINIIITIVFRLR